jgi:hypothetical protein
MSEIKARLITWAVTLQPLPPQPRRTREAASVPLTPKEQEHPLRVEDGVSDTAVPTERSRAVSSAP